MAEEERDRKWTVLRLRGLRKRWIVNTILPVLVLLMLLVRILRRAAMPWEIYEKTERND